MANPLTAPSPMAPNLVDALNVTEAGQPDGPPLVFAHGFGCNQEMWRFVAPSFAADHRVVLFDLAGFGRSARGAWDPRRHTSLQAYADDLLAMLAELDLRDVAFVGHSASAMIGVLAANAEPSRFRRLVLLVPSARYIDEPETGYVGGFSQSDIEELLDTLRANHLGWSAAMAPVIMGNGERPELAGELAASFCRTDPEVAEAFARAAFLADNRGDLAAVRVPTTIVTCAEDAIAPTGVGEFVQANIPGSTLTMLDATGHCPNLSAPEQTVAAIRAALSEGAASGPAASDGVG